MLQIEAWSVGSGLQGLFADTILPANLEDVAGENGIVDDAEKEFFSKQTRMFRKHI